jgi:DNA-binding MarR family transcriptional regulator
VLEALHCQGPAKMKTLADTLGLTARNMTAVADSLESEGLVRRVDHPSDRRVTLLELTDDGLAAADQSLVPRLAEISRLFDELSPTARQELRDTLATLVAAMETGCNPQGGC